MIFTPTQYAQAKEQQIPDDQIAEFLALKAGKKLEDFTSTGLSTGQVARYLSGIDEIDYQNQMNPQPERGIAGDTLSQLTRGAVDALDLWGSAANTAGLDKVGSITETLSDYARAKLSLAKPDVSEVEGAEGFIKRGVMGGVRALPTSVSTILPAILLAPFTGGGSVVAGALGASVFGLGTYDQAAKEYKQYNPKAKPSETHTYALKQALTEGGLEGVSNVLSFGILKLAKVSGISPATAIKQILKTPKSQLLKSWGLEALQETATESLQGAIGSKLSTEAGITDISAAEGALESVIPAVTMSSLMWMAGSGLNAARKRDLLKRLNDADQNTRTEASKEISGLLTKENEPELAQAWLSMASDKILKNQVININEDILEYDPNAEPGEIDTQTKAEDDIPLTEAELDAGVKAKKEKASKPKKTQEELNPEVETVYEADESDLLSGNTKTPYITKAQAQGAARLRKDRELKDGTTVDKTHTAIKIGENAWVLRKNTLLKDKIETTEKTKPKTPFIIQKPSKKQLDAINITQADYDSMPDDKKAIASKEMENTLGVTKVPFKPNNQYEEVNTPATAVQESKPVKITRTQKVLKEQIEESVLPTNEFKPPLVTEKTTKKGTVLSGTQKWPNQAQIDAMDKAERPSDVIKAKDLHTLMKKGFIKQVVYTDGTRRFVPADYSVPVSKETKTRKKVKPKVQKPIEKKYQEAKSTSTPVVQTKQEAKVSKLTQELEEAKARPASPEVIAEKQALLNEALSGQEQDIKTKVHSFIKDKKNSNMRVPVPLIGAEGTRQVKIEKAVTEAEGRLEKLNRLINCLGGN